MNWSEREKQKELGFLNSAYVTDHPSHSMTLGANGDHPSSRSLRSYPLECNYLFTSPVSSKTSNPKWNVALFISWSNISISWGMWNNLQHQWRFYSNLKAPGSNSSLRITIERDFIISVINHLEAQNFCFTISLFHAFTCFEHMF